MWLAPTSVPTVGRLLGQSMALAKRSSNEATRESAARSSADKARPVGEVANPDGAPPSAVADANIASVSKPAKRNL
jgi:hypothetical protein